VSTQRYETEDGTRWRVRWRDAHGKMHSRSFLTKRDAQGFDSDVKARKFRGDALPRPGKQTLRSAWDEWWRLVGAKKAESTRRTYRAVWHAHIEGRFDHHRLAELAAEPQLIDELVADMDSRQVGAAAQRKTLTVLSAVLTQCVRWRKIASNPVLSTPKPSYARERPARPPSPIVVERLRHEIADRATKDGRGLRASGDALLVSLVAYAGLRPQEALALRWDDVRDRVLRIERAASFGTEVPTKTGKPRTVPLADPLANDLRAWRSACGEPPAASLVLPAPNGGLWSHPAYNNWRARVWKPAVRRLVASDPDLAPLAAWRLYDCRGAFVSLHIHAGANPLEVAEWAGHSPAVMFRHYAAVIDDLRGQSRLPVSSHIERAREALISLTADEVREIVADSLKAPSGVSPMTVALFASREVPSPPKM
jgi:integrase